MNGHSNQRSRNMGYFVILATCIILFVRTGVSLGIYRDLHSKALKATVQKSILVLTRIETPTQDHAVHPEMKEAVQSSGSTVSEPFTKQEVATLKSNAPVSVVDFSANDEKPQEDSFGVDNGEVKEADGTGGSPIGRWIFGRKKG